MQLPDISQLLDSKALLAGASAVVGGFLGNLVAVLRARVRTLEYTVVHNRLAFSANDAVFGSIQVTWQSHNVTNLFSSRVELSNGTGSDLTNLKIKVYTGDTLLLGQRAEVVGTTHVPRFTDEFQQRLVVAPGTAPSQEQFNIYNHSREYVVPVLNRGQRVGITYLTTTTAADGPAIWIEVMHQGVRAEFKPNVPRVHGVPIRIALAAGLTVSILALVLSSIFLAEPWAAALVCLIVGLVAQTLGAFLYRAYLFVKRVVVQ